MKYVEDMNSEELRAHVRMLQASPGWYDHFADRLIKEIREQDEEIAKLLKKHQPLSYEQKVGIIHENTIEDYNGVYYDLFGIMEGVETAHGIK